MTETTELSGCPICGKLPKVEHVTREPPDIETDYYIIKCRDPEELGTILSHIVMVSGDTLKEATERWNQRS